MKTTRFLASALALCSVVRLLSPAPAAAAEWTTTSLPQGFYYKLAVGPNGHVYAYGGSQLHVSTDDGVTWSPLGPLASNVQAHEIVPTASGALYVGDFALGVFRSDDGGASWSASLVDEGCNGLAMSAQGVLLAGLTYTGNGRVHRSENGGTSWTGVDLPGSSGGFATESFSFGSDGEIYAASIDGVYRSDDQGVTWLARSTGLQGRNVRVMAVAPNQHVFVQTNFPSTVDGFYRSVDRGESWQKPGGVDPYFAALVAAPNGDLYGAGDDGVSRSTDEGAAWSPFNDGLPADERLTSIVVTPAGRLLAGGWRVHRSSSSVLDAGPEPARAAAFALEANHPNPFAGRTRIPFTLARPAHVDLSVFDVTGRRVATLARGEHPAGGHAATFDASSLPAGLYVARLEAGGLARARLLVVTR